MPADLLNHHKTRRLIRCLKRLTNPDKVNHQLQAPIKTPTTTTSARYGLSTFKTSPELANTAIKTNITRGFATVIKNDEI